MNLSGRLLSYFLVFVGVVSCSPGGDTKSPLTIKATKTVFLLPDDKEFPEGDICYPGETFPAPRFSLPKMTTTWRGDGSFLPVLIELQIPESGNVSKSTCTISSSGSASSLSIALGFSTAEITTGGAAEVTEDSLCAIHCGGVSVKNKEANFTTTARLKLIGIETDSEGNQKPVSATYVFSVQNLP